MASLDRRLNPLYAIKECSSCGNLHTKDCGCSKGSLEDKILVPIPDLSQRPLKIEKICLDCGDPVHGLYCRQCALIRKTLEEVFQDFQDTSKSSDDDTNFVNQEPFVVKQGPGVNSSQSPPQINHNCAHYGYNYPPQIPIISNPEPCYNQNLNEILQNLQSLQQQCLLGTCQQCGCNEYDGVCFYCTVRNGTPINFSTPYSSDHPPQPQYVPYSCELCGNDSHYGYDCPPQVPFVYNQDPCFNQNFDYFPQTSPSFPQQYSCCEDCGGPHETFQCQPMNEDYYHEQNSCYDSNSFGFDQFQPPQYTVNHPISNVQNSLFNAQNEFLNSQNKLMEQMTSICDMVGQIMQKKEEERRIAEEQAAKDRYWKIPICYDDDEDYTIAITPILSTEEPDNSLSMGDEHLDTIPATESDEVIKSSVENLVPILSESEGILDNVYDVPLCNNPTPLEAFKEQSETIIDSNNDYSSSDDDSYENIDYVNASPPDAEIVSLEVVEIVIPEVRGIVDDILLTIKDDTLREKLLNVNLLIANIEALKDNPAPFSDVMTKSPSTSLNLFLEETNTFDNSSPESETFCFDLEENSSGSTTTRSDYSLPDYEAFYSDDDHIKEKSSGSTTTHADFSKYDSFIFDLSINPFPPADRSDFYHEEFADELAHIISPPEYDHFCFKIEPELGNLTMDVVEDIFPTREPRVHVPNVLPTHPTLHLDLDFILFSDSLFAYIVWIFLPFLMYLVAPLYLLSCRNEDTIFDPGIPVYHSFMPGISHRNVTFMKFNVYPNHLNESPMEILSSTCSPMDQ
ncbi:hypothetical protein Tco_1029406 [Tanacetum coccineum]|uniref:CCHC-type domain-containing protein n=1 Tax=Tanacetum coccineum TaxID=301880 RepID=A0ABQ5G3N0_9ASTR